MLLQPGEEQGSYKPDKQIILDIRLVESLVDPVYWELVLPGFQSDLFDHLDICSRADPIQLPTLTSHNTISRLAHLYLQFNQFFQIH